MPKEVTHGSIHVDRICSKKPDRDATCEPGRKDKTKAKKRYLKAKKDRRKKRKSTTAPVSKNATEGVEGGEEEEDEDEEMSDAESAADEPPPPPKPEHRPKKRRKVEVDVPETQNTHSEADVHIPEATGQEAAAVVSEKPDPQPTTPNALPSFPAPTRPDAPSRATLALQGLDKALIQADLIEPTRVISINVESSDDATGLSPRMKKRLGELNVTELFAVQTAVIPLLLSEPKQWQLYLPYNTPRDLCVSAPTGSGKTLAYVVPIVEVLSSRTVTRLRALVVLPTRDLVLQVRETFEAVGKGRGLRIGTATGQHSFAHEQTQLVADRSPGTTETTTKEQGVLDIVMEKFTMPASLTEHMLVCGSSQKPLMLFYLVHERGVKNALVFTKSAESTNRLVKLFEFFESTWMSQGGEYQPMTVQAYSSELGASDRKSILERFKKQDINILVCSDLISRGIDISHVSHVVSYDAPVDMRKYVHRVGRTARAGRAGDAWTLVEEQEARYFKNMLKSADHMNAVKRLRISEKDVESLVPAYEQSLEQLKEAYSR
ncbi:hypothetical protein EUX98_g3896 [Antrodiella citrinella]|uniref:ATP-dependent RNA helicase n=1 Tax=Antrodiella citrinella TaxID=2447956 RepID=A0A4S4MXG1_9APHY|nr:hypothetical protein EUX98_g3896 [Antrodiella citrinella]